MGEKDKAVQKATRLFGKPDVEQATAELQRDREEILRELRVQEATKAASPEVLDLVVSV